MARQILRGMLDTLMFAVLAALAAANTGFMPIDELQSTAAASFGVCRAQACPGGCEVWMSQNIPEPPYVILAIETCEVAAAATQWAGFCDGVCGICPLGSRCSGTTSQSHIPCMCVINAC